MNGEVGFACRLTAAARLALKTGEFDFHKAPYEGTLSFVMCARDKAGVTVQSPALWFKKLREYGLTDIFMIMPCTIKNRKMLGFVNTSGCTIFARFSDGRTTRFSSMWTMDNSKRGWNVTVTEEIVNNAPADIPVFADNTEELKKVLSDIGDLSEKLGFAPFTECFRKGYEVLNGGELPEIPLKELVPALPEKQLRLYLAADISDVFGAMGSWSDSPAAVAAEKGLSSDYDHLSDLLLAQNRYALLHAVNYV
ncbi:MAG: RNA polymerase subunit sigma [Ruminococcaceae bacterium]|nr:RNA polymerase subunit sigma [Oscillospiraceae bacterium]